mgnify:FL=1
MYTSISILIVIASVLLTIIVLLQNSKGGGLAANFAAGNQTFGVRQTADFLEKSTWTLAITIIVLCILATAFIANRAVENRTDITDRVLNTAVQGQPHFNQEEAMQQVQGEAQQSANPAEEASAATQK